MRYRAFIFDLGNVLLKWSPTDILHAAGVPDVDIERYASAIFLHQRWLDLDRGDLDEGAAVPDFARRLGCSHDEIRHILQVARDSLVPLAPGLGLLEEFANSGRDVVCLTNMSLETFTHVRAKYDFWNRFNGIVVSGQLRMAKPEPAIFRYTLETQALDAGTTLFLDDHPANVEAARALGITAVQYDGSDTCVAQVRTLAKLP